MPQNAQFFLLANINHFATLLQDEHLEGSQEVAARLLLAECWYRLAAMEKPVDRAGRFSLARFPRVATPPPAPIARSCPAAIPPVAQLPSASPAAGHPVSRAIAYGI
jgi:hypothetical protein